MKGAQWMDIRSNRQKGLSYVGLEKKYHMDPRTTKRYAESPQKPEYTLTGPKPTKLDAYKQQIDQWLEEAPYSAVRILEKLQEQEFGGKYSIVKEYVRGKKMDLNEKATVRFETIPGKQGQMDWGFFVNTNLKCRFSSKRNIFFCRTVYKYILSFTTHHLSVRSPSSPDLSACLGLDGRKRQV